MVKEIHLRVTLREEAVADILVIKSAQSLKIKEVKAASRGEV